MFLKCVTFVLLRYRQVDMSLVKITDSPQYVRDVDSKAILNTDRNGLEKYYMDREIAKRQKFEQVNSKNRLDKLEQDMQEIKQLLLQIATIQDK